METETKEIEEDDHICVDQRHFVMCMQPVVAVDIFECKVCGDCIEDDCVHTYVVKQNAEEV